MRASLASSSCDERALTVGKAPITPAQQAADTRSTPETCSIGAAISGRRRPYASEAGSVMHGFRSARQACRADRAAPR